MSELEPLDARDRHASMTQVWLSGSGEDLGAAYEETRPKKTLSETILKCGRALITRTSRHGGRYSTGFKKILSAIEAKNLGATE